MRIQGGIAPSAGARGHRALLGNFGLALFGACLGAQAALADDLAPIPANYHALSGNANYRMFSDCKPLQNPKVTIEVTKAMEGGLGGFDFQFNANSFAVSNVNNDPRNNPQPWGAQANGAQAFMGWQQYVLNVHPGKDANTTDIEAFIEPWPSNVHEGGNPDARTLSNGSDLVNKSFPIVTLIGTPQPSLPAGSKVEITLQTDPHTSVVKSLLFKVSLPRGTKTRIAQATGNEPGSFNGVAIPLVGLPLHDTLCKGRDKTPYPDVRFCPFSAKGGKVLGSYLTPVSTFQMDIAGPWVNKGEGTISYEASNGMRVVPVPNDVSLNPESHHRLPHCTAGTDTAEGSNLIYSQIPVTGGKQSFTSAPRCESGTKAYYLLCDESAFCATSENVQKCASEGWCYPLETSNVKEQGKNTCKSVATIDKRDPKGDWLRNVEFPHPLTMR